MYWLTLYLAVTLAVWFCAATRFAALRRCGLHLTGFCVGRGWPAAKWKLQNVFFEVRPVPIGIRYVCANGQADVDGQAQRLNKIMLGTLMIMSVTLQVVMAATTGVLICDDGEPSVGLLRPESYYHQAGMQAGDRILSIEGVPTKDWRSVAAAQEVRYGPPKQVVAVRRGKKLAFSVAGGISDQPETPHCAVSLARSVSELIYLPLKAHLSWGSRAVATAIAAANLSSQAENSPVLCALISVHSALLFYIIGSLVGRYVLLLWIALLH